MPKGWTDEDYNPLLLLPGELSPASMAPSCDVDSSPDMEAAFLPSSTSPTSFLKTRAPKVAAPILSSSEEEDPVAPPHRALAKDIKAAGTPPRAAQWREAVELRAARRSAKASRDDPASVRGIGRVVMSAIAVSACLLVAGARIRWHAAGRQASKTGSQDDVVVLDSARGEAEEEGEAADCHTAVDGEDCYKGVTWAMHHGIKKHPQWYSDLTDESTFKDFQAFLHRSGFKACQRPCEDESGDVLEGLTWDDFPRQEEDEEEKRAKEKSKGEKAEEDKREAKKGEEEKSEVPKWICHHYEGRQDAAWCQSVGREGDFEYRYDNTGNSCEGCWCCKRRATEASEASPERSRPEHAGAAARSGGGVEGGASGASRSGSSSRSSTSSTSSAPPTTSAASPSTSAKAAAGNSSIAGMERRSRPTSAKKEMTCCPNYVPPPSAPAPVWELSEELLDKCWGQMRLAAPEITKGGKLGRNWCWVGMKEFGCHRHLWEHRTWAQYQQQAVDAKATVSEPFQPLTDAAMCDKKERGTVQQDWNEVDWANAAEWFEENVAVYVLSLPQSEKRKKTISKRLDELGIPFDFVWGVDMRQANALEIAKREGLIPWAYDPERAQKEANLPANDMGRDGSIYGTVGCAAGHFRAQMHAVKTSPNKPLTVILEDDVSPSDDFVPRLWSLVLEELPCDWQAVSLSSRCPYGRCISPHLTRVQPDVNEPAWRCRHGVNYGFQGVLYRTAEIEDLQNLWKPIVFNEKRPHCLDVDVALASISDIVKFYAVPAVQSPGLLTELRQGSSRVAINWQHKQAARQPPAAPPRPPVPPARAPPRPPTPPAQPPPPPPVQTPPHPPQPAATTQAPPPQGQAQPPQWVRDITAATGGVPSQPASAPAASGAAGAGAAAEGTNMLLR